MRLFASVVLIFLGQSSYASLAPRLRSIMTQLNSSITQSTSVNNSVNYSNKFSFELLYLVRGGPTFGGRYFYETRNENEAQTGQAYGPMAGYYAENGFFALINYDVLAKLGRWTNGEGFEVGLGYLEHIGDQIHIGAKYSARRIRYKTDKTDNTAIQKNVSDEYPSITLMYLF